MIFGENVYPEISSEFQSNGKKSSYILSLANFTQAKPFFVTQSEVVSRGNITTERESWNTYLLATKPGEINKTITGYYFSP